MDTPTSFPAPGWTRIFEGELILEGDIIVSDRFNRAPRPVTAISHGREFNPARESTELYRKDPEPIAVEVNADGTWTVSIHHEDATKELELT